MRLKPETSSAVDWTPSVAGSLMTSADETSSDRYSSFQTSQAPFSSLINRALFIVAVEPDRACTKDRISGAVSGMQEGEVSYNYSWAQMEGGLAWRVPRFVCRLRRIDYISGRAVVIRPPWATNPRRDREDQPKLVSESVLGFLVAVFEP